MKSTCPPLRGEKYVNCKQAKRITFQYELRLAAQHPSLSVPHNRYRLYTVNVAQSELCCLTLLIRRLRLQEGYNFVNNSAGIITMAKELKMKVIERPCPFQM